MAPLAHWPRGRRRRRSPGAALRVRARHLLRRLLRVKETPPRIALSFAVGVFIAFFPVFGTHTALVLLSVLLLRLNFALTLAGAFVNNPWTLVPIYAAGLGVGMILTGRQDPPPDLDRILAGEEGVVGVALAAWSELRPFLLPFVLGCLVLGIVAAGISYAGVLTLVRWGRGRSRPGRPGKR
jgi:uncharacterized protein (DUF2062 family)